MLAFVVEEFLVCGRRTNQPTVFVQFPIDQHVLDRFQVLLRNVTSYPGKLVPWRPKVVHAMGRQRFEFVEDGYPTKADVGVASVLCVAEYDGHVEILYTRVPCSHMNIYDNYMFKFVSI